MRSTPALFWVAMAVIGGGALLLMLNHDSGSILGVDNDMVADTLRLGVIGMVVSAAVVAMRMPLSGFLRNIALWLLIVLALVAGYQYRYELQDVASRVTAGLVPGSPLSIGNAETGNMVRLDKVDGHFVARADVDGASIAFMVDTGATLTVLTAQDARRAGIDPDGLRFDIPVSTANGIARAARATVEEIGLGPIVRRRMPVMVAAPGMLGQSLLGMNFIGTLSGFDVRGDAMILRD